MNLKNNLINLFYTELHKATLRNGKLELVLVIADVWRLYQPQKNGYLQSGFSQIDCNVQLDVANYLQSVVTTDCNLWQTIAFFGNQLQVGTNNCK